MSDLDMEGFERIFRQRGPQKQQEPPEVEQEPEEEPHYVDYERELKSGVFDNLAELAGIDLMYQTPGSKYKSSETGFVDEIWMGEEVVLQPLVEGITAKGVKDQAITYLDREISIITIKIQGSSHFRGRLLPVDEDSDSGFWDLDHCIGSNDRTWWEAQRVEVERIFLAWLNRLWKRVFVHQPAGLTPQKAKGRSTDAIKVKSLVSLFREKDHLVKLTNILKAKSIVDSHGNWNVENKALFALCEVLCETKRFLKIQARTPVGRSLCLEYGLGDTPFDESNFRKNKNPVWLNEFQAILNSI